MGYATFVASADYTSKMAGAALAIKLYDESNIGAPIIGGATGLNESDDFESIPIEEAGNDGVDEIVQGRHTCAGTIQAFWSPQRNDALPTRQTFIGKKFTIVVEIAPGRPGAGSIVDVFTGAVLNRRASAFGARGARTIDIAYMAERHYNGTEWAEKAAA